MKELEMYMEKQTGGVRTVCEILREIGRISPRAAEIVEQDIGVKGMSPADCYTALYNYAKAHQKNSAWSCAVFGVDPENEAVKVILDFYKIPSDWVGGKAAEKPAEKPAPAVDKLPGTAGGLDLMDLL